MRPISLRTISITASLAFLIPTILAIYSSTRITSLHLPVLTSSAVLAVILPITGIFGGLWLSFAVNDSAMLLTISASLSFVFDGALFALASSRVSEQDLSCAIETLWRHWFESKNSQAIRGIQDQLDCCGLRSTRDKAWPFPDNSHDEHACEVAFGRSYSCFKPLSKETKNVYLIFLAIAVINLALKIIIGFLFYSQNLSQAHFRSQRRRRNDENRPLLENRTENNGIEESDHGNNAILSSETGSNSHWL